jgi:hypothetical protein
MRPTSNPGANFDQLRDRHGVVGLVGIAPVGRRPMRLGDCRFEIEHGVRARLSILGAGKPSMVARCAR